jgi:hypothetical protein
MFGHRHKINTFHALFKIMSYKEGFVVKREKP